MSGNLRTIGGKEMWVEENGAGPIVVFIHGLGGTCNVFDAQVEALADTHRVVSFDLTGHGMSPLAASTSVAGWGDDVVALLGDIGASECALVAHSLGRLVAQQVLSIAPDSVSRVVFLGPVRDLPDAAREAQHDRAQLVRAEGMTSVAQAISRGAVSETTRSTQPAVVAFVKELLQRQSAEGYAAACEALGQSSPPDVAAFQGSVLAVTGTDDGVSPPDRIDAFAGEFTDAKSHAIEGIGHWTSLEATSTVTGLLVDFLG